MKIPEALKQKDGIRISLFGKYMFWDGVKHARKGIFKAIAREDFDPSIADWYPLILAHKQEVSGRVRVWVEGDKLPCRASLCSIKLIFDS